MTPKVMTFSVLYKIVDADHLVYFLIISSTATSCLAEKINYETQKDSKEVKKL